MTCMAEPELLVLQEICYVQLFSKSKTPDKVHALNKNDRKIRFGMITFSKQYNQAI